jgi:hypothetical protein
MREEEPMKKLIVATAIAFLSSAALAQNTGPAPQTGMDKPGMTNGAKESGAMDTKGMSPTKGNIPVDRKADFIAAGSGTAGAAVCLNRRILSAVSNRNRLR